MTGTNGRVSLSVVIPTLNASDALGGAVESVLDPADRFERVELIVSDGGSTDGTSERARSLGARVVAAAVGRGPQLDAGARAASGDLLLFLHADTRLGAGWADAVAAFAAGSERDRTAGYFRFVLDDPSGAARRLERIVAWRNRVFGLPYGDQGLVITRDHYERIGGFRGMALMEDVDMVRRIGRTRMRLLAADAVTSAARYRRGGYIARPLRNLTCLLLYGLGVPPAMLQRIYG